MSVPPGIVTEPVEATPQTGSDEFQVPAEYLTPEVTEPSVTEPAGEPVEPAEGETPEPAGEGAESEEQLDEPMTWTRRDWARERERILKEHAEATEQLAEAKQREEALKAEQRQAQERASQVVNEFLGSEDEYQAVRTLALADVDEYDADALRQQRDAKAKLRRLEENRSTIPVLFQQLDLGYMGFIGAAYDEFAKRHAHLDRGKLIPEAKARDPQQRMQLQDAALEHIVQATRADEAKKWQAKLKEEKADLEARLTRAGGSLPQPVAGGRAAQGGRLTIQTGPDGLPTDEWMERARRGEFAGVNLRET